MAMTREQVVKFREHLGRALMTIQNHYTSAFKPYEVLPQMIAALVSLAAYIARNNANLSRTNFRDVCEAAADEQYSRIHTPSDFN